MTTGKESTAKVLNMYGDQVAVPDFASHDKRFTSEKRKYNIQNIWSNHHEMKRYIHMGMNNKQIASILGCTPQNVSDVRNSDIMRAELEVMKLQADENAVDISKRIKEILPKALMLLEETIDDETAPINSRIRSAEKIIDKQIPNLVKGEHAHEHTLGADELAAMKERALSEARRSGLIDTKDAEEAVVVQD